MSFGMIVQQLAGGFTKTLLIFVLTLLFSMPLGLLVAFCRMSKFSPLRGITKVFISILRGTPLMLQLLVAFYGPYYIFKVQLTTSYRFVALILGFVINYSAYFAEIYRSGIESIPVGQYEAANILGYSKSQTFIRIIFPQMVKRVIPPVTNEVITLVKDTSLSYALAYSRADRKNGMPCEHYLFTALSACNTSAHISMRMYYIAVAVFYNFLKLLYAFPTE